jgi:hypothetical protein
VAVLADAQLATAPPQAPLLVCTYYSTMVLLLSLVVPS